MIRIKGTIVASAFAVSLAVPAAHGDGGQQARVEVQRAERAIQAAREQRALWTTARDALDDAHAALERGDFTAAVQAARFAQEQARLGIEQAHAARLP